MVLSMKMVEQIARGNCTLLLGPAADLNGLAQTLAIECAYPPRKSDRSLPAVARYYQALTSRQQLVARLKAWLEKDQCATPLQRAVAALPVDRVVDFGYDDHMVNALCANCRSPTVVICDSDFPYADRSRVLLLKPYGTASQPDSLVLNEEDHAIFFRAHPLMVQQLRIWAATQVLLWVNVNPSALQWQRFHEAITADISPCHRRECALARTGSEAAAWVEWGVTPMVVADPVAWLERLGQAVVKLPPPPADTLPGSGPLLGRRPYKFLDFYTADDTDLFFGRDRWADELAARVLAEPLVVLFGQSGVGKTSLLLAGVLPRLEVRDGWPVYARPMDDPIESLRAAVEAKLDTADRTILAGIADLGLFIRAAGELKGKVPIVVLDQVEECFTALAPAVRERWVAALAQALHDTAGEVRWVLSLREDYAAELHEWTDRVPGLFDHTARLTPLGRDEAREAIAQPPARVGAPIDESLVERLLADLESEGVAPAQLQIVCDRLYLARDREGHITLAAYEALGGTRCILAEYVDFALVQLPPELCETAVELLRRMANGRETKLPLRPEEVLGSAERDTAERRAALNGLLDARLVRSLEWGGERRYELAHEVLLEKVRDPIGTPERQAKVARDLLREERTAWEQLRVLPEREKVTYVHQQRENPYLHLDQEDTKLMLRAALREGLAPAYWGRRAAEAGLEIWPILAPALGSPEESLRMHAVWALAGCPVPQALEVLRARMSEPSPHVRVAVHQALYYVGSPQARAILDTSDDLRLVPAGKFIMGGMYDSEEPHYVDLDAFLVEKYPVTNEMYAQFIAAGGYQYKQYWTQEGRSWLRHADRTQPTFWEKEIWPNWPNLPVMGVSWYEAWAYAHWAGRRLLSEAEWEKAARGADGRLYPWGNTFDNTRCNVRTELIGRGPTPVGYFSPQGDSPYGVVDMAGNILEWTSSLKKEYPYDADDGRENPQARGNRVIRGGSWMNVPRDACCMYRLSLPPNQAEAAGFRCGVGVVSSLLASSLLGVEK